MKPWIRILLFLMLFCDIARSQDISFSTLEPSLNYYNPALTGLGNGIRISALNRMQWPNIATQMPSSLFKANYLNFEALLPNVGATGISYMDNTEGEGKLHTSKLTSTFVFPLPLPDFTSGKGRKIKNQIGFGIKPGFYHQRIDWQNLQFADQFDPVKGLVTRESSFAAENNPINRLTLEYGFFARFNYSRKGTRKLLTIGFSQAPSQFSAFDISIMNIGTKIATKTSIQGLAYIELPKKLGLRHSAISAHYIWENQAPYKTQKIGFSARKESFILTCSLRNRSGLDIKASDAIIYTFEWIFEGNNKTFYRLFYSYDMTVSGLAYSAGGAHEGGVVISLENVFRTSLKSSRAKKLSRVCTSFSTNAFLPTVN